MDFAPYDPFRDLILAQQQLEDYLAITETKESLDVVRGTWVPVLAGTTTPGTFTYTLQSGTYIRHENMCFIQGIINITVITVAPVGLMDITGLPFASSTLAGITVAGGAEMYFWNTNLATAHTQVGGQVSAGGATSMRLTKSADNVAAGSLGAGDIALVGGAVAFRWFGVYDTNF